MPRRPYGAEEDFNLLRLALMEQDRQNPASNAFSPGRAPSSIAMNAYLGSIPRTFEQEREGAVLGEADRRYFQNREDDRARQGVLDDAEGAAAIRNFETRRGVTDESQLVGSPAPGQMRTIRRFGTSTRPTDPDTAATATQKAARDPRVLAEQIRTTGDVAAAKAKADAANAGDAERDASEQARRDEIVRLAQEIRDSGELDWNVGPLDNSGWIPTMRGEAKNWQAKVKRLKDLMIMGARGELKGTGPISNFETDIAGNAEGALDRSMSESGFRAELDRIIGEQGRRSAVARQGGAVRRYNPATGKLE